MEKSKEIKLKFPIKVKGVETTILKIGRIKTKHLKLLPDDIVNMSSGEENKFNLKTVSNLMPLFASLAGIEVEEAEEIDVADLEAVSDILVQSLGN
jgi:hypothetical protein